MIGEPARPEPRMLAVRRGGLADLDPVMGVMEAAFAPCFGERWSRSQCAGILPMSGVRLTVAEGPDGLVGFSLMRAVMDEAELLLIAVSPAAQGRGVGSALLRQFEADARQSGAALLHLEVRDGNPAVDIYRKAGFRIVGRRRDYYRGPAGESYDALTMAID